MQVLSLFLVRWRWLLMILSLLVVGAMASGGRHIAFATDYEVWFSDDNPQFQDFINLQNTYDKSDNVLFLITPKHGDVFTASTLDSVEWLTKQTWKMPYTTRVDSVSNFQHTEAIEDDLIVADLVSKATTLSTSHLQRIKQIALQEPLLLHRLISEDARVTAVSATINLPKNMQEGSPTVVAYARDLIGQLQVRDPNLEIRLTGLVLMDNAFMEASMQDMSSLTLIMFALILFGLVVLLRSITGTLSVLFIIMLSIMATMGFSGWTGVLLTPVSAGAPTIVMTIVVAHAVHILVSVLQGMRAGSSKRDAVTESLRINIQPIFLASITTIIGFLSMHFSDVPPFHHLGNMVAVGVVMAFLLCMTVLPWLLMLLPMRVKQLEDHQNRYMLGLSHFIINRRNPILVVFSILSISLASLISQNEVNDKIWEYFDTSVPFRMDTDYASEHLTGTYHLEYALISTEKRGITEPAYLKKIDSFQQWLSQQPEVIHVNTIADIMKRLHKNMHGDHDEWYRLPENKQLAAQYLLLYEMSLPYGLDLNNQINLDKSATRITVSLHNLSSSEMIAFNEKAEQWLTLNASELSYIGSSPMYMFSHISKRTVYQMMGGVAFALVLISVILMFALRSFKIGLISLVPNLVPPLVAFGIWGVSVGQVGFAESVAIGMTIGIIVDDTVHFLSKYLRARREKGLSAEEAVSYALSNVGVALMITTLVLVAGFSVLMLSTFKLNYQLGAITALTIGIALILDFFLLPALLILLDKRDYKQTAETYNKPILTTYS
ncbi:MAG: MMPL family transporter [Methyloprofundus sp.]|nr:MMPL family transporter [Methyloprofundus sp.]